jgi:DNA replication protein DnaC
MASRKLLARESELAMLERLLSDLLERGHSLIIRGDPGVGKSALLAGARGHGW